MARHYARGVRQADEALGRLVAGVRRELGDPLIVVVAGIGFASGRHNDRFMTCADFSVAGSSEPENCSQDG